MLVDGVEIKCKCGNGNLKLMSESKKSWAVIRKFLCVVCSKTIRVRSLK
jgi:hypothetical protein